MKSSVPKFRAFTLIELLVVIAIIAILAAILFPVLSQAKNAAMKSVDISNFKQVAMATQMYVADYDDTTVPANLGGYNLPTFGIGPPDKTPGVLCAPYCKSEAIWFSPMDPNAARDSVLRHHLETIYRPYGYSNATNISQLTPEQQLFALMVRSNMGYNYGFLSPWRAINVPGRGYLLTSAAIGQSEIESPTATLMYVSSIWDRTSRGVPVGAGNWVVEAPCVRDGDGNVLPPVTNYLADGTFQHYHTYGWVLTNPYSWMVYGGAWPWHNQKTVFGSGNRAYKDGQVIVAYVDGHTKSMAVNRLVRGCNPLLNWAGRAADGEAYIWDLR